MERFDPPKPSGELLPPVTILGTPVEAGLNQKNSTSLTLGTQTAFDFYPPKYAGGQAPRSNWCHSPKMLNGAHNPPEDFGGSNLVLNVVTHLNETT